MGCAQGRAHAHTWHTKWLSASRNSWWLAVHSSTPLIGESVSAIDLVPTRRFRRRVTHGRRELTRLKPNSRVSLKWNLYYTGETKTDQSSLGSSALAQCAESLWFRRYESGEYGLHQPFSNHCN